MYNFNKYTANQIPVLKDYILQKKLNISDYQAEYITNSEEGEGLIVYDGEILPFKDKFPKNNSLYPVMTSKPEELAAYRNQ